MNEKRCRELVYARSNSACEMCDRALGREVHHRKNRSQGGKWTPENALHLCTFCHHFATVNPAVARENGWSVSAYQDPATVPALLARHGLVYLTPDGQTIPTERTAA